MSPTATASRPEYFLGIDPGKEGAMVLLSRAGEILGHRKLETTKEGKDRKNYNLEKLSTVFNHIKNTYPNIIVCLEHLHAIPGLGALAGFMRGYSMGMLEMLLVDADLDYVKVTPRVWKPVMVGMSGGDKKEAILAAARLFPNDIWRFEKPRKGYDDNVAEAMLLAEYGRRKNL